MDKRAKLQIQDIIPIGLVLVVAGILLSFGAEVGSDIADDEITNTVNCNATHTFNCSSYGWNISQSSLEGVWELSDRIPTIGLVAAIVIVIGLLISGFGYLMGRR